MKKITLALCACAFALTGLLASCSSEASSVNYTDVTSYENTYKYAVRGTIKTTDEYYEKTDQYGDTNKNGKETSSTTTTEEKVTNGKITVQFGNSMNNSYNWVTNENMEANWTYYIISGKYTATSSYSDSGKFFGDKTAYTKSSDTGINDLDLPEIYEINGEYYFVKDGEFKKIEEFAISEDDDAFDGDFGGEFSLNIKFTEPVTFEDFARDDFSYDGDVKDTSRYEAWKAMQEAGYKATTTTEYKLTFIPLEDFDPEEEFEEDEE